MNDWRSKMHKTVRQLAGQLSAIRPDTVSIGFLETFRVVHQGSASPIGHLATLVRRGNRIAIAPFDRSLVPSVVKALTEARLNAYAADPATVCVSVPPISGEQRLELARHVKALGEQAKVAVRSIRQSARKQIAAAGRGSQRAVQEATDAAVAEIDRLVQSKVAEIGR
jgi:ribosome recycling factor